MIHVYPLRVMDTHCQFINYTYILINGCSNEALIVDPGWEFKTIMDCLAITESNLKGVLLTHHHVDHTNLATSVAKTFNVPIFISEIERSYYGFECFNLQTFITDQPLRVSSFTLFPYHTPGHTKGSICFQINDSLFTGDTLFVEGCGICSDRESAMEMFTSVQKLKLSIEPTTNIYPGHCFGLKPGVTFEFLLTQNIYCHLDDPNAFVSFRMRKYQTGFFNFK